MTDPVKALSDEELDYWRGSNEYRPYAMPLVDRLLATIAERTRERDETINTLDLSDDLYRAHKARAERAEADNARLLSPSDYALEIGAYMLAKSAATWFGDRIPETFDLTMSKSILKPAYFAVCEAALSPTPVGER